MLTTVHVAPAVHSVVFDSSNSPIEHAAPAVPPAVVFGSAHSIISSLPSTPQSPTLVSACLTLCSGASSLVQRTTGRLFASLWTFLPSTFEFVDLLQGESEIAAAETADAESAAKARMEANTEQERDEADLSFIMKVGRRRAARLLRLREASQEVAPGLMSKRRLPHNPQQREQARSKKRSANSVDGLTAGAKVTSASFNFEGRNTGLDSSTHSTGDASSARTGCRVWLKPEAEHLDEGERTRWFTDKVGVGRNNISTSDCNKWTKSRRLTQQTVSGMAGFLSSFSLHILC